MQNKTERKKKRLESRDWQTFKTKSNLILVTVTDGQEGKYKMVKGFKKTKNLKFIQVFDFSHLKKLKTTHLSRRFESFPELLLTIVDPQPRLFQLSGRRR